MQQMNGPFDIIGDIHGCSNTLQALLAKLGYQLTNGAYRHADRRVVFLGDFIDRGPGQREVIEIARAMVDSGSALAVMANHEFNAIAFATPDGRGGHLREHSTKNLDQHAAFLEAYPPDSADYLGAIQWFKTLPLWLDLGSIRVVHACWDPDEIGYLADPGNTRKKRTHKPDLSDQPSHPTQPEPPDPTRLT
jgi:hypothetical protein